MQLDIFDLMYEPFKITKPIKLIEFFGGYGSQALALKYLGANFEHHKLCEWAVKSIQAYKDVHMTNDDTDYSKDLSIEEVKEYLFNKGISSNYNEPMTKEQINRLNEKAARTIYNNIQATHNLVNIQQVKGDDLEINDKEHFTYLLTYSFPCQDLSLAGKGKGMSDTSTRSGMLWEVERILQECENKPDVLLMENVPMVHSADNVGDFAKWIKSLESMGYKNYWKDLIATNYGIPQTRNRCFMVSILGDYKYTFPEPIPLKLKLKDLLEDNVDEKYYLSDAMLQYMMSESSGGISRKEMFERNFNKKEDVAATITTMAGQRASDNFIKETENYIEWKEKGKLDIDCRASKEDKVSTTICTTPKNKVLIKNATKQGYLEAEDGDGVDISSRMEYHRGTVQKGKTQTLTTMGGENNGVVVLGNYSKSNHNASRIVDQEHSAPTVMENHGTVTAIAEDTLKRDLCNKLIQDGLVEEGDVVKHSYTQQILDGNKKCVEKNDGNMITLTTRGDCVGTAVKDNMNNLRIRKLTPRECLRLMAVREKDINNMMKNQSDASLYHLAGDSIVCDVLVYIFKNMMEVL